MQPNTDGIINDDMTISNSEKIDLVQFHIRLQIIQRI